MWKLLLIPVFLYVASAPARLRFQARCSSRPAPSAGRARCRPAPSARASRPPTATGSTGSTSRPPRPPSGTAHPRLRRQCLERARAAAAYLHDLLPRPTSSPSTIAATGPRPAAPSAEALLEDAPLIHDLAVAPPPPRPDRRGRLQRRQRRRRQPGAAPPARRPDPGHAVRFAEARWPPAIIPGCRCAGCSATR